MSREPRTLPGRQQPTPPSSLLFFPSRVQKTRTINTSLASSERTRSNVPSPPGHDNTHLKKRCTFGIYYKHVAYLSHFEKTRPFDLRLFVLPHRAHDGNTTSTRSPPLDFGSAPITQKNKAYVDYVHNKMPSTLAPDHCTNRVQKVTYHPHTTDRR